MRWAEQATLLVRKASQDAVIVRRAVEDPEIADEIIGFHVQQAAEKRMKAVLCTRGVAYRRTHDLQELHDALVDSGRSIIPEVAELVDWSPFAIVYRYAEWSEPEPVDRTRATELVEATVRWATATVGEAIG
jgi:HEPN domain-containing protein